MKDAVIVNFASQGRENYLKAQLRMIKSFVEKGWDGDYLIRSLDGWVDQYMGVPIKNGEYPKPAGVEVIYNHNEVPYQFKLNIILEAKEMGYKTIIWVDSTITMEKDLWPAIQHAQIHGVAAFDNIGHPLKNWISDIALERLGITEEELETIPQIMACVIVFQMNTPIGVQIFNEWLAASQDGVSFQNGYESKREGFIKHRHDQAVLSGILWKHGIPLLPYGNLVYEPHDKTGEYGNFFYFVNRGIQ